MSRAFGVRQHAWRFFLLGAFLSMSWAMQAHAQQAPPPSTTSFKPCFLPGSRAKFGLGMQFQINSLGDLLHLGRQPHQTRVVAQADPRDCVATELTPAEFAKGGNLFGNQHWLIGPFEGNSFRSVRDQAVAAIEDPLAFKEKQDERRRSRSPEIIQIVPCVAPDSGFPRAKLPSDIEQVNPTLKALGFQPIRLDFPTTPFSSPRPPEH